MINIRDKEMTKIIVEYDDDSKEEIEKAILITDPDKEAFTVSPFNTTMKELLDVMLTIVNTYMEVSENED